VIREALDQWDFVLAAYAVGVFGILATIGWSWLAMRRAERRRDHSREQVHGR
jgi:nitrate reductase gamma subunit